MLAVNLLPWRVQRWQQRRKQSFSWLALTLATTLLLLLALWLRGARLQNQQATALDDVALALTTLQQQLTQQQALIQLRDSLQEVNRLQQQRQMQHQRWQHFWLQLPDLMPDVLWLNRVERRQGQLLLEGQAQSMAAVSEFRHQLITQPLFSGVKQGSVQRQASGDYRFALQARVQEMVDE